MPRCIRDGCGQPFSCMEDGTTLDLSRRALVGASAAASMALAAPRAAAAAAGGPVFELVPRPTRKVFKTRDRSHENTESWIFSLAVQTASSAPLTPAAIEHPELLSRGVVLGFW